MAIAEERAGTGKGEAMHGLAQTSSPRGALRHPFFWAALALLIVNDHLLKGAGVLPGWLTGKLSDLAGLIVAPILLCALFDLRAPQARALAFGAVAAVFSALELSPRAALAWDAMLGAIGIPFRSWADPTDLIALAVLPIAWWMSGTEREAAKGGLGLAVQRSALAVGLFACIATSPPPPNPQWLTGAWIHNPTSEPIDVRLRWAEGALDCARIDTVQLDQAAAPELFGEGITFRLEPGDTVPLEPQDARAALGMTTPGGPVVERNACDLVSLSIDGLGDRVVFWRQTTQEFVPANDLRATSELGPNGLGIFLDETGAVALDPSPLFTVATLTERASIPPASCLGARGETVAWSAIDTSATLGWTVEYRGLLVDGCTQLDLVDEERTEAHSLFLCVPADFVPFVAGDRVSIGSVAGAADALQLTADDGRAMIVARGTDELSVAGFRITAGTTGVACAERLECGAYVAPVVAMVDGAERERDAVVERTSGGLRKRMLITRAERAIVGHPSCDSGRDAVGAFFDAVVILEPEPAAPGTGVP